MNKEKTVIRKSSDKEFTVSYRNGAKRNKRVASKQTDELEEVYNECKKLDRENKQNITINDFFGNCTVFEVNQTYSVHKPYKDYDNFYFERS